MKKSLVSMLALSSLLLLSACSNAPAESVSPPTETKISSEASTSASSEPESSKEVTPEELNKIDVKFEITNSSKNMPYGVNYDFLTEPSQLEYFDTYSVKDIHNAAKMGLKEYYDLRTEPGLFKTDRTIKSDSKVIDKHSKNIGNFVLDDWEKEKAAGRLFSYVPLTPFLNMGTFDYEGDRNTEKFEKHLNKYNSYYVDTRETQKLTFDGAVASEGILNKNSKPSIQLDFSERVEYALAVGGTGVYNSNIQLLLQKDSKGAWKIQGMHWAGMDQTLEDANGATLPALKKAKK